MSARTAVGHVTKHMKITTHCLTCTALRVLKRVFDPPRVFRQVCKMAKTRFLFFLCVAYSPDGKRIVSASNDKLVKIWNADTGAEVHSDPGSCVGPYAIAYRGVHVPSLRTRTRSLMASS